MNPTKVVEQFVEAVNAHALDKLAASMTDGHRFVDSLGNAFEGRQTMREGWNMYFSMVPDYRLEVSKCFEAPDASGSAEIVLIGEASGSYACAGELQPDSGWSTPVAIRAIVCDGLVAEWQVYADNEPLRERMRLADDE